MTRGTIGAFRALLDDAHHANDSLLCVGLDPELTRLPQVLRSETDITRAIVAFNAGIIEATSDLVYCYKPNLAFYMAHGVPGLRALEETRRLIPRHIPALLDAKVGDLANTSIAYAAGYFDAWDFDAVTVNPYMGEDSLAPYLSRGDRGIFVLCKTSNPGSGDLQDIQVSTESGGQPLYLTVADRVAEWTERWPATSSRHPEALPNPANPAPGYWGAGWGYRGLAASGSRLHWGRAPAFCLTLGHLRRGTRRGGMGVGGAASGATTS